MAALVRMATRADELSSKFLYYEIIKDLSRFTNVQVVLPKTNRMNAVLVYYERIKHLRSCKKNPNSWLQYAVATLALNRFDDARIKIDTAYSYAQKRERYDTFMIDNTAARLELMRGIQYPKQDRDSAIGTFRKARNIINSQIEKKENRHYPFRVASLYSTFLSIHRNILEPKDIEEIVRGARFILRRIESLSAYRANQRYIAECRETMEEIVSSNPIVDT